MKQLLISDFIRLVLADSYTSVLFFSKLKDKWNNPEDIAQRAAEMLRDTHNTYGKSLFLILKKIEMDCKHPKKMYIVHKGVKYCTNCHMDLEKKNVKNKL